MSELGKLQDVLDGGRVDAAVFELRPDYRAMLLAVDGLIPGPSDDASDALLRAAEAAARKMRANQSVEDTPHVAAWREAYRAFEAHQIPVGGEDLSEYAGPPRLIRATGEESFDTVAGGEAAVEHPNPGEVVWCDDAGVTCRRWNWRQGRRTQLTENTTKALFILDALDPINEEDLDTAADSLTTHLHRFGPDVTVAQRLIHSRGDDPSSEADAS